MLVAAACCMKHGAEKTFLTMVARTSIKSLTQVFWLETAWPSGLRRYVQVVVRKGVGSNPTAVSFHKTAIHQTMSVMRAPRRSAASGRDSR